MSINGKSITTSVDLEQKADMMKMSDKIHFEDITANKGFLIKTDITFVNDKSFFIEIKGNPYSGGNFPINTLLHGYIYNNVVYTAKAINLGENISSINIFNLNNKICLWVDCDIYFTGLYASAIYDIKKYGGNFTNLVTEITVETKPVNITQEVVCVPKQVATADKIDSLFEVGTWTPTVKGHTISGTNTYTHQRGQYIRNGKSVKVDFLVKLSLKDTGMVGVTHIGGLPFKVKNSYINALGNLQIRNITLNANEIPQIIAGANGTYLEIQLQGLISVNNLPVERLTDNAELIGSISYIID